MFFLLAILIKIQELKNLLVSTKKSFLQHQKVVLRPCDAVARGGGFGSNLLLTKACHFLGVRPILIKQI